MWNTLTIVGMTDLLVEALGKRQAEQGLSQVEMAKRLNISETYLALVRGGKRKPGVKFLRGVVGAFPDLQLLVWNYVASE